MPFRETFWNIPHWAEIGQYVVAALTIVVFLYGTFLRFRRLRAGRPAGRKGRFGARLWSLLTQAVGQFRTAQEPYPGIMHLGIFWGMLALLAGTALATVDWDVTRLFFGFQFLEGGAYLVFELILDVLGLAALVGLALAAYRRYVIKPVRLQDIPLPGAAGEDAIVLLALLFVVISGYLVEGLRIAILRPDWANWSPVGNAIAAAFASMGEPAARGLHVGVWVAHGLAAFTLLASMPFTKLFHIVAAPVNIFFAPTDPPATLTPARTEGDPGVKVLKDFTWKQLLDFGTCIRCGRCQDQCPAYASGLGLSPRDLMVKLAGHLWEKSNGRALHGQVVKPEELWACSTCRACVQACPVFTDQLSTIVDLRRHLVIDGQMDGRLQEALANLGRYGNSFGQSERARAKWTQPIQTKIKDARREPVEVLWFLGDYASYNAALSDVSRKTAEIFQRAGLDFGILYDSERNAGNDARRAGEEGLFEMLREKNEAVLTKCTFKSVVTTDPHTYNALKHEYPSLVGNGRPVMHVAELMDDLISSGRLKLGKRLNYRVTYHDPCYLGRYNGVYRAPRRVIEATGCSLVEMPRHGARAFCCGAGGGRIWMDEGTVKERPSESRIREAMALDGVQVFAVACPKDLTMYQDALKTAGPEGRMAVRDLIELVHEAL